MTVPTARQVLCPADAQSDDTPDWLREHNEYTEFTRKITDYHMRCIEREARFRLMTDEEKEGIEDAVAREILEGKR